MHTTHFNNDCLDKTLTLQAQEHCLMQSIQHHIKEATHWKKKSSAIEIEKVVSKMLTVYKRSIN